jgi:hypothetical protein
MDTAQESSSGAVNTFGHVIPEVPPVGIANLTLTTRRSELSEGDVRVT